jgi:hypothetical protein
VLRLWQPLAAFGLRTLGLHTSDVLYATECLQCTALDCPRQAQAPQLPDIFPMPLGTPYQNLSDFFRYRGTPFQNFSQIQCNTITQKQPCFPIVLAPGDAVIGENG